MLRKIFYLNVIDAICTLLILAVGKEFGAYEANPVMGWLLSLGPLYFLFTKVLLVGAVLFTLSKLETPAWALKAYSLVFCVYVIVCSWHATILGYLLWKSLQR